MATVKNWQEYEEAINRSSFFRSEALKRFRSDVKSSPKDWHYIGKHPLFIFISERLSENWKQHTEVAEPKKAEKAPMTVTGVYTNWKELAELAKKDKSAEVDYEALLALIMQTCRNSIHFSAELLKRYGDSTTNPISAIDRSFSASLVSKAPSSAIYMALEDLSADIVQGAVISAYDDIGAYLQAPSDGSLEVLKKALRSGAQKELHRLFPRHYSTIAKTAEYKKLYGATEGKTEYYINLSLDTPEAEKLIYHPQALRKTPPAKQTLYDTCMKALSSAEKTALEETELSADELVTEYPFLFKKAQDVYNASARAKLKLRKLEKEGLLDLSCYG